MLTSDDLAEAEGYAQMIRRMANVPDDEAISTRSLARKILKTQPQKAELVGVRGRLHQHPDGRWIVYTRRRLSEEREEHTIGHELGHYVRPGRLVTPHEEALCDAIGAALVAPRLVVARLVREKGARVHAIASMLHTEQALVLLRIGEVTGRPVLLWRPAPTPRGDTFNWTDHPRELPRSIAHLVRVDHRWGMMAA